MCKPQVSNAEQSEEVCHKRWGFTLHSQGMSTQQKQNGFNHRVVTLVADKLKRQWLCIVYFANCIRQPERKLPRPSTT